MSENIYLTDFFEKESKEKKGNKKPLLTKYSGQRFLPYIKIPVEYTVIIAIGFLVLVIISYAIGVERGKGMTEKTFSGQQEPVVEIVKEEEIVDSSLPEENINNDVEPVVPDAVEVVEEESSFPHVDLESNIKEVKPEMLPSGNNYIVQLASFRSEGLAKDAVERLRWRDFNANFVQSGSWYQVYVAGYKTIEEAKKAKNIFDESYIDCYIRKVN